MSDDLSHPTAAEPERDRPSTDPANQEQNQSNWLETVVDVGEVAANVGKTVINSTIGLGGAAAHQTYHWLQQATEGAGQVVTFLGNLPLFKNPVVRKVVGILRLDWLFGMADTVDLNSAEAEVERLQQKYPQESPAQISHRIMVKKAMYASGIGFASSMLPGVAMGLLAVDLAATTALQTEMVYQIAAAYGLDLHDPSRRGEVLAVFGLAIGGRNAVRAGLGFMRNIPLAGAMIGASTNATMLYSLGYAAQRFYEAQLRAEEEPDAETVETLYQESEAYLEIAIAQQKVMDQILAHMVLASYPDKTWEDILPELQSLQIDPNSLETIADHLKAPEPLGALVDQLNCDFAMPLLAQCRLIAARSGEISPAEAAILEAITEKCDRQLLADTEALEGESSALQQG